METRLESALRLDFAGVQAGKVRACLELAKPRITVMILLVACAGFWLASDAAPDWGRMLAAAATLAVLLLALLVNWLSGALALLTAGSYLFLYTPLKTRTLHCTLIGAFPGAMPPLLGWAAARGRLGVEAWVLLGILFFWQFPHFHSIAWLFKDDCRRARIRMWPVVETNGRITARQIAGCSCTLFPISLLPAYFQLSGPAYLWGACILGVLFLYFGLRAALVMSRPRARQLLLASVLYLPLLLLLTVLDKL
jgi:protoheme IX farnesyltransferase